MEECQSRSILDQKLITEANGHDDNVLSKFKIELAARPGWERAGFTNPGRTVSFSDYEDGYI